MKLDKKLQELPLVKTKPTSLDHLFGEHDLQTMWVADSDFQIAAPIQQALIERIRDAGFGYEYKPTSLFEAQRAWYQKQYGVNLVQDQILFSPSIPTTLTFVMEELTSPGDGIIIQPPVWNDFRNIIRRTKRKVEKNLLQLVEGRYEINFEDLEEKASASHNKAFIICNPHNPVGRVWTKAELSRIIDICRRHDLLLISDEIHKDVILFGHSFTSLLHYADEWNKLVVCTSEAKSFNLPGILDSLAIIPNENLRKILADTLKKYHLGRTNALSRVALETAYQEGEAWLLELRKIIEQNVSIIEEELHHAKSSIKLIKPEGTFQVWLDFRAIFNNSKVMFKQVTQNSKVALNAGHWYGREGALFMRMNIATTGERVRQGIRKVIDAVL